MKRIYFLLFIILANLTFSQQLKTISISAVGDIMFGTDYPTNRLPNRDGEFLLNDVKQILSSTDLTIGNYEGVLLDGGQPHKKCKDSTNCYLFRTPTRYVKNLVNAGFDFISVANNHANDFGSDGLRSTMNTLSEAGIKYSGVSGQTCSQVVDSLRCGFIAFSTSSGMYSILDIPFAIEEVKKLKNDNDIVIVSFHGGAEGKKALHVSDTIETDYGEQRGNVINFSRSVIDAGADLVIGHGPHVPRAIEIYKDRLIAYSLGNFCTYSGFNIQGENGLAPILKVLLNSDGTIREGEIISAKQHRGLGTMIDKHKSAFKLIMQLTQHDFPETNIQFNNEGIFHPKKK